MLNNTEVRVLLLSLPTGIIDSKSLFGATEQETRRLRTAFSNLHNYGYLTDHIVAHDTETGRDFTRSYLTQAGAIALCDALPADHPLQVLRNHPVNIRSGRNESHLSRMVRYADVSCFLACAGAETALTCPLNLGYNPFFVGVPNLRSESPNLEDILKDEAYFQGFLLPELTDSSSGVVYFQSDYVRIARKYNNSIGLLIDFAHKDGYIVLKSLFRKPLRWCGNTYTSCLEVYFIRFFKDWKIQNTDYRGNLRDAILVVDTKAELIAYLDRANKYEKPFSHIFVFLRRAEGFESLRHLLADGLVKTLDAHLAIAKQVYGVTGSIHQDGVAVIDYHGAHCRLGTIIDIKGVATCKKSHINHKDDYIICFADQVEYYSRVIKSKYLLAIPRH